MIKKIKDYWILILVALVILYFPFIFLKTIVRDYVLNNHSKITKGVVIDERNYIWNDKVNHSFTYSYKFILKNSKYKGDSNKKNMRVGDSILIEYYPVFPSLNRLLKQKK
jgi:hypothetical protein